MDQEQSGEVNRWLRDIHDDLVVLNGRVQWLLAIAGVFVILWSLHYAKWI